MLCGIDYSSGNVASHSHNSVGQKQQQRFQNIIIYNKKYYICIQLKKPINNYKKHGFKLTKNR